MEMSRDSSGSIVDEEAELLRVLELSKRDAAESEEDRMLREALEMSKHDTGPAWRQQTQPVASMNNVLGRLNLGAVKPDDSTNDRPHTARRKNKELTRQVMAEIGSVYSIIFFKKKSPY
jgi:hypothetical protein